MYFSKKMAVGHYGKANLYTFVASSVNVMGKYSEFQEIESTIVMVEG